MKSEKNHSRCKTKLRSGTMILLSSIVILGLFIIPVVSAEDSPANQRSIRMALENTFYEGETVFAYGITDFPVGTTFDVYVTSEDSGFSWSEKGTATVYKPSDSTNGWNDWKVYIQPDGWPFGTYNLLIKEPITATEKADKFRIVPVETATPAVPAEIKSQRAIRGAVENTYYEGETVLAYGITNFPVGTTFDVYVSSEDSDFTWTSKETATVYKPSDSTNGWNDWKVYIQPDGWPFETYALTVTEPGTGSSKILSFSIAPVEEAAPEWTASQERAIRGTVENTFYEGETVLAYGITNFPVGTTFDVYISSEDSGFEYSQAGTATVYKQSETIEGWNNWKVYIQPDGWPLETYALIVTEPVTGSSKTLSFSILSTDEYDQEESSEDSGNFAGLSPEEQQELLKEVKEQNDLLKELIDLFSKFFGMGDS